MAVASTMKVVGANFLKIIHRLIVGQHLHFGAGPSPILSFPTENGIGVPLPLVMATKDIGDATAVQRLNEMVSYLSRFLPNLTNVMKPQRQLMQRTAEWQCG